MPDPLLYSVPIYSSLSEGKAQSLLEYRNHAGSLRTFVPAFDLNDSMTNRAKMLTPKKFQKIDLGILEETIEKKDLVKTIRNASAYAPTDSIYTAFKVVVEKCLFPLKYIFFSRIFKNRFSSFFTTRACHYFNILGILFTPIEVGPSKIVLIFKANNLKEEKLVYQQEVANYAALLVSEVQRHSDPSGNERLRDLKDNLDQEKIRLDSAERELKRDRLRYAVEVSRYIFSNLAFIISFSPFKSLIDVASIIQKLPALTELFDYTLSSLSLSQTYEKVLIFDQWEKKYKEKEKQLLLTAELSANKRPSFPFVSEVNEEQLNQFVQVSESLLEKRLATRERRVNRLLKNKNDRPKMKMFLSQKEQEMGSAKFASWYVNQTRSSLFQLYVVHQEKLDLEARKQLSQIISKKLEFEKKFIDFKYTQTRSFHWYSTAALSVAITLGLAAFAGVSVPIASTIFLSLAVSSIAINLSFWVANYVLNSYYKKHESGLLNFRISLQHVRCEISNYWLKVMKKELTEKSPNFLRVAKGELNREGFNISQKEVDGFLKLEKRTADLLLAEEQLKTRRRQNKLIDFDRFSNLKANKVIESLVENFKQLDLKLISPQLADLIQIEIGLDTKKLQRELAKKDPAAATHALSVLHKDLMIYLTQDDSTYTTFMSYQITRLNTGNLKSLLK